MRDRRTRGGQEREAGPIEGEGEGEVEVEVEAGIVGGGRCELEMPSSLSLLLPCLRDLEIASTEMPRDRRWRSLMTGKRAAPLEATRNASQDSRQQNGVSEFFLFLFFFGVFFFLLFRPKRKNPKRARTVVPM